MLTLTTATLAGHARSPRATDVTFIKPPAKFVQQRATFGFAFTF